MELRDAPSTRSNDRHALLWYMIYGSALAAIITSTLAFWVTSFYVLVLFSYDFGLLIKANPKYATIACTIVGALVSAATIWLLNRILQLMSKQIIASRGVTLSTIEVWTRMYNRDIVLDRTRISISFFTIAFWTAALYLGTAYTTLITPTVVLTQEAISGTEIDFGSQEFWDWYNYVDADGNFNRTIMGCGWTNYNNSRGSVVYQTCAYDDTISFLTAGQSAAQYELGVASPVVSYLDKRFEGLTGGTLPQGIASWPAFSNIEFSQSHLDWKVPSYNYTLHQQGLTADVSCQATDQGDMSSTYIGFVNTTIPGLTDGSMNIINYTWTCPGSNVTQNATVLSPREAWANLEVCEFPANSKEYTIYIGAFGDYANTSLTQSGFFPNLTCTLTPLLTNTTLEYRTTDSLFRVTEVTPIADSTYRVPNETYQGIDRAFSLAVTNWNNMIIDSIHGLVAMNSTVDYPEAMAKTLKGYIEFYSTNLRMYYTANEPPGTRPVTGNFTVWRVGYHGQPIVLASLLPPLGLVCGLAITYVILGLQTGVGYVSSFNPIDGLPMLVASAAGGRAGMMPLHDTLGEKNRDSRILRTSVMYDATAGHLITMTDRATEGDVELVAVRPKHHKRDQLSDNHLPLLTRNQESLRLDPQTLMGTGP